jgi:hypothetical protein
MEKFLAVLGSRKFWASVVSLLVVFQVAPEGQEGALVESILTVVTALGYIFSIAYEKVNGVD